MASIEITASERRRQTRSNIYHCLYDTRGFCSRQTLAQSLGLSLPTIYQNLDELIADGLVRYSGESQSTGGRKASGLEIVPDARVAVGVAITEDRLRFSAADLRLNEIAYHKVPHTARFDMDELGGMVARELERFLDECHIQRGRLLGVCIALPGVTDPEGTRLLYAPTIHLRDVELSGLTRRIPYPTYVENDANCSGYAEWFMRGDRENMAYLSLENGVGGAIITEQVFVINGVGTYLITAINNRNYPVVQSTVLVIATIFIIINLIVDLLYCVIDPRISYE